MHGVDTATGCDGGAETVVVMAVGAAVLVAAVVVLCLVSGEKSGEGMREIGRAAETMTGEDGLRCEGCGPLGGRLGSLVGEGVMFAEIHHHYPERWR